MIRHKSIPWQLLKKFLLKSFVLFALIFGAVYLLFQFYFLDDLQALLPSVDWGHFLNVVFFLMFGSSLMIFGGMLGFAFVELLVPLGVLYSRVRAMSGRSHIEEDDDDLGHSETGEWSDMETALHSIKDELLASRKKMAENKTTFRTLLDALPEGILAVNTDRRPIFYNESFLSIFGLRHEGFKQKRIVEMIRAPEIVEAFERCLAEERSQRVQCQFGDVQPPRVFQVSVSPLRPKGGGSLSGAISIFQDVTELKNLETIRIDFVANVSHELRTPLTSVKGYTQTLMEDIRVRKFDQGEKYLGVINRNVDRLLALVSDLLDLSSLDSGMTIDKTNLQTKVLTQHVLEQVEPLRSAKGVDITSEFEAAEFLGDGPRVEQVLLNLVQNGIQYVPTGGKIKISWNRVSTGVELRVKDSGYGIPPEHLRRIFERFYRVDRSRARESGGTGLGLAIVKHIMIRHGGSVKAESEVGKGTEFVCFFPGV